MTEELATTETKKEKLQKLVTKFVALPDMEDTVLYKWGVHGEELKGTPFIPLTDVRLHMVVRYEGRAWYNALAPVVYEHHGVPVMRMQDRDVVKVTNGTRQGTLQDVKFVREGETTQVAPYTGRWDLEVVDAIRMRDTATIMDILTQVPLLPAVTMTMPDIYKITLYKTRLVPNFCDELIDTIMPDRDKSTVPSEADLIRAFERYEGFYDESTGGYVFPFKYITRGGISVVPARLVKALKPVVRKMPLRRLLNNAYAMHWRGELLTEIMNDKDWDLAGDAEELEQEWSDYGDNGDDGTLEGGPIDSSIDR